MARGSKEVRPRVRRARLRFERLENRMVLAHCGPYDLMDGHGPQFIGDGLVTINEDFSNNPNHEELATVDGGFDSCVAGSDRLFSHSVGIVGFIREGEADIPFSQVRVPDSHMLIMLGADLIVFEGIHPDFHVAAVSIDVLESSFPTATTRVEFVGQSGTILTLAPQQKQQWESLFAARGTLLPTGDPLGPIASVRIYATNDFSHFDNITIVIDNNLSIRNQPPTATDDRTSTLPETPKIIDVVANDSDPNGDRLSIALPGGSSSLLGGKVEIIGQAVRYTPPIGFPGPGDTTVASRTDSFSYDLIDEHGESDSAIVEVLINTPPVAVSNLTFVRPRGAPRLQGSVPILPQTDRDGDAVVVELVDSPERGTLTSFNPDGTFVYEPSDPEDVREDFFTYQIRDALGAVSNIGGVRLEVPNQTPVAINHTLFFDHGVAVSPTAQLGNDPDGDPIGIVMVPYDHDDNPATPEVVGPQHGIVTFSPDGTFVYTQRSRDYIDWNSGRLILGDRRMRGPDRFDFQVADHAARSAVGSVRIDVPNLPPRTNVVGHPVLIDRFVVPADGSAINFQVPPIILEGPGTSNAELQLQVHDDRLDFQLTVSNLRAGLSPENRVETVTAHLHLGSTAFGGPVVATLFDGAPPNLHFTGQLASGTITIADLEGPLANGATFEQFLRELRAGNIYIDLHTRAFPAGELHRQILGPISDTLGDVTHVAAPGVLLGDIDVQTDREGNNLDPDPLTALLERPPGHGQITLRPDGSFSYAPNSGFTGLDTFTYRATDGFLTSPETLVELAVVSESQVLIPNPTPGILHPTLDGSLTSAGTALIPTPIAIDDLFTFDAADAQVFSGDETPKKWTLLNTESIRRNDFPVPDGIFDLEMVLPGSVYQQLGQTSPVGGVNYNYKNHGAIEFVDGKLFFPDCFIGTRYFAYAYAVHTEFGRNFSNIGTATLRSHDRDSDNDGVSDSAEGICEPFAFDGVDPSTHLDAAVARLPNAVDQRPLRLASSDGSTLHAVSAQAELTVVPPPRGVTFPVGFVSFEVRDIPGSGTTAISFTLPPGLDVTNYWKFGPEMDNLSTPEDETNLQPHWWKFTFDPVTGTGAIIDGQVVTLHFADGQRGDLDGTINGIIADPGGPGISESPLATVTGPGRGVRGQPLEFQLNASLSGDYTYDIDWDGDGAVDQSVAANESLTIEHVFPTEGEFTIHVALINNGASSEPVTHEVTVDVAAVIGNRLLLGGTAEDDKIRFYRGRPGELRIVLNRDRLGPFSIASNGHLVAFGQAGDDRISVSHGLRHNVDFFGGTGNDFLLGGRGDDLLDGGDGNDLLIGFRGDDVLDGGRDDDRLFGFRGNNVLVGAAGNDRLFGGLGRDLLIGGLGRDRLFGIFGQAILVSGVTSYDNDRPALRQIVDRWARPESYAARVAALRDASQAVYLRKHESVFDDEDLDWLFGTHGSDWLFFDASLDVISGRR